MSIKPRPHSAAPMRLQLDVIMAAIALHRGKYQARIRRSGFPTISKSFTHKKDAVAWAALTEREIERGEYQSHNDCTRFTLADLLDRYQKDITPTKRSAEIELLRIGKIKRSWISTIKVGDLQPHHIAKYRDERLREIQGNAVARDLSLISDVMNIAIKEWGYPLKRNPVQLVRKPPSNRNRNRRLENGEAQSLLTVAAQSKNIWLIPIIEFALETAMRRGEILGLRWADVDMEKRTLHLPITKNGGSRMVPLSIRARTGVGWSSKRHHREGIPCNHGGFKGFVGPSLSTGQHRRSELPRSTTRGHQPVL